MPVFLPFSFYLILVKEEIYIIKGLWFFSVRIIILCSCENSRMHVCIWMESWWLLLIILLTGKEIRLKVQTVSIFPFFKILFLERGERKEKERERNKNMWLPLTCSLPGTWPAMQACALTGNRTSNPLVCRPLPYPLSHTSQGQTLSFFNLQFYNKFLKIIWTS